MTLNEGWLEDIDCLALLGGADVAVDLHRRLARRVAEELLCDPRMDAGSNQQSGSTVPNVIEPIFGSRARAQRRLEVLVNHEVDR